jgi:hypothetical protein
LVIANVAWLILKSEPPDAGSNRFTMQFPGCSQSMAFHHGIKQAAWRFATPRFAPDGKEPAGRAVVCEGGRVRPVSKTEIFRCCFTPPPGVISPRHETKADGTPISRSARCGFGNKKTTRK